MALIRIERTGMCEKCPYPHLYLERIDKEDMVLGDTYTYSIDCRHRDACSRAYDLGLSVIDKLAGLKEGEN